MSLRDELKKAIQETDDTASIDDLTENVEAAVIRSLGPDGLVDLAKQLQQVDIKAAESGLYRRSDGEIMKRAVPEAPTTEGFRLPSGSLFEKADVTTWRWDEELEAYVLDPDGNLVIYDDGPSASAWMESLSRALSKARQVTAAKRQSLREEATAALELDPPNWTYWEALQKQLDIEEGKAV